MEGLRGFEKIAPYLTHPLVLVGFGLLQDHRPRPERGGEGTVEITLEEDFQPAETLQLVKEEVTVRGLVVDANDDRALSGVRISVVGHPEVAVLRQAVERSPDELDAWTALASAYEAEGRRSEAEEAAKRAEALRRRQDAE